MVKTKIISEKPSNEYISLFNKYTEIDKKYYDLESVMKDEDARWSLVRRKLQIFKENLPTEDLLKLCEDDPIYFSTLMLGITPRPHQMYLLERMSKAKRLAMCLGRRLGKTKANQIFILWGMIFNKYPSELAGTSFSIICQDLDTGKDLYIEEMYMMLENGDEAVKKNFNGKLGDNYFTSKLLTMKDKSGKVTGTQISMRIKDGDTEKICKARALPPTNKARGKEGNIIGDEVSFWKKNNSCSNDIDFYDTVIHPILSDNPNYISIMSSTPDGYGDIWEKTFDPEDKHFSEYEKVWLPCWAYSKDWYTENMKKEQLKYANRGESWKFQQEYEARFVQMRDQYFDEEKHIQRFLDEKETFLVSNRSNDMYMGLDFGGTMTSHTAIAIVEQTEKNMGRLVFYKEYVVNEDASLLRDIHILTKEYPGLKKIVYDNKGGRYIEQQLTQVYGDYFIQPFNFTTDKQKGYSLLKLAMNNGNIKCPKDKLILSQLRNFTDKLKPMNKEISDDVLDATMMAFYNVLNQEYKVFNIINY